MADFAPFIAAQDSQIHSALVGEFERQRDGLELIPSENYVSRAVLEANGSVFTNKYSEGYPGKRYYGGQEYTDIIERVAIDRLCQLFGCQYANVQPHAGAIANVAMYFALLKPGDTVLGMDLSHGGHLTHGHPVTCIAKIFNFVRYKMKDVETGEIDYDALRQTALAEKPKIILAGFSAYPRELDYQRIADIAKEVGAYAVADMAHIAGLIAGKALKNPFDYGFDIITSTTHKSLRGPRGGVIMTKDNADIAKKIDKAIFPGLQGGPLMHHVAARAVCFGEALKPEFQAYAQQVLKNAKAMEAVFHERGLKMITGGTSNHLILADVHSSFGVEGKRAQAVLDEVGITLNMNSIPDDPRPPLNPSGIRLGTPAITTRGFAEPQCAQVAHWIIDTLQAVDDEAKKAQIKADITALCQQFPIPDTFV